jgi:hypothetical protein
MNPRLFAAIVLAALTCTAATYGRTWTDASGNYSVGAELVGVRDGLVHLKKPDVIQGDLIGPT